VLRLPESHARLNGLLDVLRGRPERSACEGWIDVRQAIARARPRHASWHEPPVAF
jgi:hypothetical protein